MPKTTSFEDSLLKLIFNNTPWGSIAAGAGATTLYVSLHSAAPGATGAQSTSEIVYTSYARKDITPVLSPVATITDTVAIMKGA